MRKILLIIILVLLFILLLLYLFRKKIMNVETDKNNQFISQTLTITSSTSTTYNIKDPESYKKGDDQNEKIANKLQIYNNILDNRTKIQEAPSSHLIINNLSLLSKQVDDEWKSYIPFMRAIFSFMDEYPQECMQTVTNLLTNPEITPKMYVNLKDLEMRLLVIQNKNEEAYQNAMEVIYGDNSEIMFETGAVYLDFIDIALNVGKTNESVNVANKAFKYLEGAINVTQKNEYKENLSYITTKLFWLYYDSEQYEAARSIINKALKKLDENANSTKDLKELARNTEKIINIKMEVSE